MSTAPTLPNIAIIGGGLGGLVTLLTLHRRGIPATVYERDEGFDARAHLGGTLDLDWTSGQRALRENGLQEAFDQNSRPEGDEYKLCDAAANVLMRLGGEAESGPRDPTTVRPEIDRSVLRKLLLDACPADSIKWGHTLVSARALSRGQHKLTFADGTTTTCDVLVGADGANSRIRPLVSSATPSYTGVNGAEISLAPSVVARPDMADVRTIVGNGTAFFAQNARLFCAQMNGDGRMRTYAWFLAPESWELPREQPAEARRVLLEMFAGWHPTTLKLIEHCDDAAIYSRPLYHLPADHRWTHVDGVTLVGDAAHLMTPFAGEGANMAMLGGLELGLALAATISGKRTVEERETAVRKYEEKMFAETGKMAKRAKNNLEAFINPDAPATALEMTKRWVQAREYESKGAQ